MKRECGIVYLVGAGPGDPGLITVRGRKLLRRADVVVYDRLIATQILAYAPHAEHIDAGKAPGRQVLTQDEINTLLIAKAKLGKTVVRLKGGDPFVFGRGSEELAACRSAEIPCLVVPGVTSAIAGPAAADIPLTQRGVARSVAFITAEGGEGEAQLAHDYDALARVDTLVVLMGRASLANWTLRLLAAGKAADTPAACIASATTPDQRVVTGTLATISEAAERSGLAAPMITVVGEVAREHAPNALRAALPLAGRRILLTAAADTNQRFAEAFVARGAIPLSCPLIKVVYPPASTELRGCIQRLLKYDWVVFSSRHGVRAFFRALRTSRRDARALARCRIAAVGPGTARALLRCGVRPDLVPGVPNAEGLAAALREWAPHERVLYPRSNLSRDVLANALRAAGTEIDDPIAYRTEEIDDSEALARALRFGCDALVLCSPSAARCFARHSASASVGAIVALGTVTAEAATQAGLRIELVAASPSPDEVISALEFFWSNAEATR